MSKMDNFKWLTDDINNSLILKVVDENDGFRELCGIFNISDVLETVCDELDIATGNVNDLTNLLTLGVVKFTNVSNQSDILEIPFRNLYLLYKNANVLGENSSEKLITFGELDAFSVIDGAIKNDLLVFSAMINEPTDDLKQVVKIAYEYNSYGMQERTDALGKITIINHRRLVNDKKEKEF